MNTFNNDEPIGLLAGSGRFPILFAEKARAVGRRVVCVGIKFEAPPELADLVDRFYWAGLSKLGTMQRCFRREGVKKIVMAGKIHKSVMFTPFRAWYLLPDWHGIKFWLRRMLQHSDNRDDSLILDVMEDFKGAGMDFDSALNLCPELLAPAGVLTRRQPTVSEQADIAFGWMLAKEMGRLDVGQSVMVKEKAVLAVEAIEGTDRAIQRAGELCRAGGFVVVKVAKPQQDMRFDVPTIGPQTIENLYKAKARVLAIEANKTIILDREITLEMANHFGLTIVAQSAESARAAA